MSNNKKITSKNKKMLKLLSLGTEIAALIVASVFVGQVLDQHFQTRGLFLILLILVSFFGWFYRLILVLKQKEEIQGEDGDV